MRPALASSLLFVSCLASATLHAQWVTRIGGNLGCPVDFSVERTNRGTLGLRPVQSRDGDLQAKRSVSISLRSEQGKTITAADITVYAPRISNNATPARVVFGPTDEAYLVTKTYHLVQGESSSGVLTGDLDLLDTMAGVERASVRSVTYSDGTTWRPMSGAACTAVPSIFMLVANR